MGTALAFATQLLSSLPGLIAAGIEVVGLINRGNEKLKQFRDEKRDPTEAEWDELNASIDAKRRILHSPQRAPDPIATYPYTAAPDSQTEEDAEEEALDDIGDIVADAQKDRTTR